MTGHQQGFTLFASYSTDDKLGWATRWLRTELWPYEGTPSLWNQKNQNVFFYYFPYLCFCLFLFPCSVLRSWPLTLRLQHAVKPGVVGHTVSLRTSGSQTSSITHPHTSKTSHRSGQAGASSEPLESLLIVKTVLYFPPALPAFPDGDRHLSLGTAGPAHKRLVAAVAVTLN